MNVDWRRLKAVVLESDDWGLCAWSADEEAYRALAGTPTYRSAVGRRYGRSTLETAEDVRRLCALLEEFRGADGQVPVWQANTVMAAPDFARLAATDYRDDDVPLVLLPEAPARWQRPGLWEEVRRAIDGGAWWPELHGLLHVPAAAWLRALRRGDADARLAAQHESVVCRAAEAGSECGPREPWAPRERQLAAAVRHFGRFFGRAPHSFCPPDYGWDRAVEEAAARAGLEVLQGWAEQSGVSLVRRALRRMRWPRRRGALFAMPARIAFEPRGEAREDSFLGARLTLRATRAAWAAGRPAVVSSHRHNYAHLDPAWSEAGRAQLRALLAALMRDGASFLTDAEVLALHRRGWSLRALGKGRVLLRRRTASSEPMRLPLPSGARGADARPAVRGEAPAVHADDGVLVVAALPGDYLIEWRPA